LGITKKGKEFFKLTSSLTESINNIFVEETNIWTSCEYIYNAYENGADVGFYMCHDQIHSMLMEHVTRQTEYSAILGCQDSAIRIVNGSQLTYETTTPGPVMALCSSNSGGAKLRAGAASVLFGTGSGSLSHLSIDGNSSVTHWTIQDDQKATITDITSADITQDGNQEICVVRDDGRVDVYAMDGANVEPVRAFSRDMGEWL
jgi:Bardet-Biedl syndrome 7 protein